MSPTAIRLGPFELHEVVGRGGMGDVWRASHVTQSVEAAIKVVTSSRAQSAKALAAFRNEVHAMARLDHPGVVMVLDVGEVSDEAAVASAGILRRGNPVLAMEYATHGTLDRVRDGLHWRRLRAVLLSILDALAHAHARGVIHRDLKPGNILVTNDHRGRPVLKLADFGLAEALFRRRRSGKERKVSGTPRFMAPEQIEGRMRDQGPWTDLYALGCLAYWMLTGAPPFGGDLDEIFSGHLFEPPPKIETSIALPAGFEDWVLRLLAKRPRERYRCAADAAYGLLLLDDGPVEIVEELPSGLGESITDANWTEPELSLIDVTVVMDPAGVTADGSRGSKPFDGFSATILEMTARPGEDAAIGGSSTFARPPLPMSWERAEMRPKSMQLVGAGLGLYGLRPIPLVGRRAEREAMWSTLRMVHETGQLRVVTLTGAAGAGKSRLADWLCERVTEVGGAGVLRAFHGPEAGPGAGLARMLADHLRCVGLEHQDVAERVRNIYFGTGGVDGQDLYDARAIAEIIVPTEDANPDAIRFSSPIERYVVIARFLARLALERPQILWIDDAHWGLDALEFTSYLLSTGQELPILILMTVRAEGLTGRAAEAERLAAIARDTRTQELTVEPLESEDHAVLVSELLGLEPELAQDVAQRTDGNPLFAVQLVGDWIQRGLLVVRNDGFALGDDAVVTLPDSIHELWLERIEGFLQSRDNPETTRRQIELAACLGQEVDRGEWLEACGYLGHTPDALLLDALLQEGLVTPRRDAFAFSHGMLKESIVRRAEEEFRLAVCHHAAAQMLEHRYDDVPLPETQERIGTHLFGAGDWEGATQPLLDAAANFGERSDFERAKRIVALRDRALDAMGVPADDERRGEGWHIIVRCNLREGLVDRAGELINKGVEIARNNGWAAMLAEFELHLGSLARKRGETEAALEGYQRGYELFGEREDHAGMAKGLYGIGECLLYRGEILEAVEYLERARQHMADHDLTDIGVVLTGLVAAHIRLDNFDEAHLRMGEAIEAFKRVGNRGGLAAGLNMLGELERARNQIVPAEAAYRESISVLESIGSRGRTIPRLNLGLVYLARSKWTDAQEEFELGLEELLRGGEKSHVGFVHLALCCAAGGLKEWTRYDRHLAEAIRLLEESAWVDRDIAQHAEIAASLAEAAGESERAEHAMSLAQAQWHALGEPGGA